MRSLSHRKPLLIALDLIILSLSHGKQGWWPSFWAKLSQENTTCCCPLLHLLYNKAHYSTWTLGLRSEVSYQSDTVNPFQELHKSCNFPASPSQWLYRSRQSPSSLTNDPTQRNPPHLHHIFTIPPVQTSYSTSQRPTSLHSPTKQTSHS